MKTQTYRMTMLFDFYGEILTERQKEFSICTTMRICPWERSRRITGFPDRVCGT